MDKIFGSPSTYIQGPGALYDSADHLKKFGTKAVLLADEIVYKIVGTDFLAYLEKNGITVKKVVFGGEASEEEVTRVGGIGKEFGAEMIIGLGGGKTLDSAKAIGDDLHIAVVILPTLASTDAPCSRLSVIYTPAGEFSKYRFYSKNPDLVLVDTKVVAGAPASLFASGIADALATNVEAQAVALGKGKTMLGANQTLVGNAIAEKCEETLFEYGMEAYVAVKSHVTSKALDKVVEANTLMSGVGFESGGLSAAHAIHNGLTALHGDIHKKSHGEKVAFGTLSQLFLEGADQKKIDKFLELYLKLDLPTTFADLNIPNVTDEDLLKVGTLSCADGDTMQEMPFAVEPEDVVEAMKAADAYATYVKANR
jgi:glycerol dehydrogenase